MLSCSERMVDLLMLNEKSNILIENGFKELVASGELMKPDPLRVTLKRVILTGYPLKVNF